MRQLHEVGDELSEDFSGKKPFIVGRQTRARADVQLFVAVLGASSYTYAEATAVSRAATEIAPKNRGSRWQSTFVGPR